MPAGQAAGRAWSRSCRRRPSCGSPSRARRARRSRAGGACRRPRHRACPDRDGSMTRSTAPTARPSTATSRTLVQVLPPSRGLVDPALGIFGIEMAQGGHVDDAGVGRMDDDAPDVVGFLEARVLSRSCRRRRTCRRRRPNRSSGSCWPRRSRARGCRESDGATAMSPIEKTFSLSKSGSKVWPLFSVFHSPPERGRGVEGVRPSGAERRSRRTGRSAGSDRWRGNSGRSRTAAGSIAGAGALSCGLGLGREAGREGREQDGQGQERDRQLAGHGESPCPDQRSVLR